MCYAFPYDEVIEGIYKGYGKRAVGPVAETLPRVRAGDLPVSN